MRLRCQREGGLLLSFSFTSSDIFQVFHQLIFIAYKFIKKEKDFCVEEELLNQKALEGPVSHSIPTRTWVWGSTSAVRRFPAAPDPRPPAGSAWWRLHLPGCCVIQHARAPSLFSYVRRLLGEQNGMEPAWGSGPSVG